LKIYLTNSNKKLVGAISILASAFLFYIATFFVKLGAPETSGDSIIYMAMRFWLGYLFILFWYSLIKKTSLKQMKVVNRKWLWHRAFWNMVAVMFFYLGVIYGSLTGANILNMTYPVFVAMLSIYLLNEKPDITTWFSVFFSVLGTFFVLWGNGDASGIIVRPGEIFGLFSGITAGISIVALRIIRITDTTEAALFYNFRLGSWCTFPFLIYYLINRGTGESLQSFYYPLLSGVSGILGQVALTYGFKFVTAVHGSILSASRLLFAVLIGWLFFRYEVNLYSVSGATVIFIANIMLVIRKKETA